MKKIIIFLVLMSRLVIANNVQFEVSEGALNAFAEVVGSIEGEENIKILFIKVGAFKWKIDDIKIDLKKGAAELKAKVTVEKNGEKFMGELFSELTPKYEPKKKQITLKTENIRLDGINFFNIERVFSPKFKIPVNLKEEKIEVKIGKNNKKNIRIIPRNEKIEILEDRLILSGDLEFEETKI